MTLKSLLLPIGLLVLTGCPETYTACTTEARSSITVNAIDEDGAALLDATASYSIDGGESTGCDSFEDGSFACGWEAEGEFTVTIEAPGYTTDTFTQTVTSDECHVLTEVVDRTLTPLSCTDEEVPSIAVTVVDSQGAEITTADVMWNMAAEDDLPEPCMPGGGNLWYCAGEVSGDLVVEISNAGPYEAYSQGVTVTADECHVITEQLDAVLQYLPD